MDSSLLPRDIPIKTVERNDLWYRRYEYCLRVHINEGSVLRYRDHDVIDRMIARRKEWGRRIAHATQPGSWVWKELDITDQDLANLHTMCDVLLSIPQEHKIMISSNWIYIYTEDVALLDSIIGLEFLDPSMMSRSQVILVGSPDTVIRKNSRYSKRSFFRNLSVTTTQLSGVSNYLLNQDSVRPSPSLKWAMSNKFTTRFMDYFFVDHDDDSALIMLSLIVPNVIRKTLPIRSYK
jgi:hypothetical protein